VQDAEAYQRPLDIAAQANAEEGIRQGLDDARKGRIRHEINAEESEAVLKWYFGLKAAILRLSEHPNRCPVTAGRSAPHPARSAAEIQRALNG
jgi:hypothetical protein